jgi:protein-L-isoaspartate O-methyltransferase
MQEPPGHFHETVRQRFAEVAITPDREKKFPVGPESAKTLGYDPDEIDELPTPVTASFCGVGNPLALGELRAGETVLDLGSGAGLDSILAARRVGLGGRVIGVDMTPEMIAKSRGNVQAVGLDNVEFRQHCRGRNDTEVAYLTKSTCRSRKTPLRVTSTRAFC